MPDWLAAILVLCGSMGIVVAHRFIRLTRRAWASHFTANRFEFWPVQYDPKEFPIGPSNPTRSVVVDRQKLSQIEPALAADERSVLGLQASLGRSDGQPAVVVSVQPLLIAVYNDELDLVTFLRFGIKQGQASDFKVGQRMVSATIYGLLSGIFPERTQLFPDLVPGPHDSGNFDNVMPRVIDLISSDIAAIERIRNGIPAADWKRLQDAARSFIANPHTYIRDGRPSYCHIPISGKLGWAMRLALRNFLEREDRHL